MLMVFSSAVANTGFTNVRRCITPEDAVLTETRWTLAALPAYSAVHMPLPM